MRWWEEELPDDVRPAEGCGFPATRGQEGGGLPMTRRQEGQAFIDKNAGLPRARAQRGKSGQRHARPGSGGTASKPDLRCDSLSAWSPRPASCPRAPSSVRLLHPRPPPGLGRLRVPCRDLNWRRWPGRRRRIPGASSRTQAAAAPTSKAACWAK